MENFIKDNTPDLWAKEAVDWAVQNSLLFGDENGNYKLHEKCTRQEMLIFLNRLHNLIQRGE
ncbi:MAG: S-layer homology domain-containing protein [Ruminococcaceae bacterium]|nr:S-layer homology domain-containing protein [Oscillospiraceae bacterium]